MNANKLVAKMFSCPKCGNRRIDSLILIKGCLTTVKDDIVQCGSCGSFHDPNTQELIDAPFNC